MDDALSAGPKSADEPRRKAGFLDRFFRSAPAPSVDLIEPKLWTVTATEWSALDASYRTAILEQYKIYAEMADRISARRGQANTAQLLLVAVFRHAPAWARYL